MEPPWSPPPERLLVAAAPMVAAWFTAIARLANELLLASTSRIRQAGQAADTMSRSSEISCAQPPLTAGGVVPPDWLTLRKHGFVPLLVQAGRPYCAR